MSKRNEGELRRLIAQEAARILADHGHGTHDYARARDKAAQRLHCQDRRQLPSNQEIEEALLAYRQLFDAAGHADGLRRLRQEALEAMGFFRPFQPRLVGPVLSGAASRRSPIQLHLFCEYPELLIQNLIDRGIRWEDAERTFRYADGEERRVPLFRFQAGSTAIELFCFPLEGLRTAPLDPVDGRPQRRAGGDEVRGLLEADGGEGA